MASSTALSAIRLASFNCRSVKNSNYDVINLCNKCDIVCLQEHWLLPNELNILNNINTEFISHGYSSVNISDSVLVGRPYGGTAILFRKSLSHLIKIVPTTDPRVTAIRVKSSDFEVLFLSVYMPTDYGDQESADNFVATCGYIEALFMDSDISHLCIAGDMNCRPGSRFHPTLCQFASDCNLTFADEKRLCDAVTLHQR